ncbi:MAG: hypothetical protein K1X64_09860 [Myxococcaceae bacterium]|nr:hypothetical protein [Myxococcaceae bacterium]
MSGQFLSWDGTAWVCATAHGTSGTSYAAGTGISIDAHNTISVTSGGCSAGNVLQWSGTSWTCAQVTGGTGGVTSVNTGTGLTGGPITSTGTISIANGGIASTHLAAGAVTAAKLSSNGCSANDVMRWNGTAWVCVSLDYGRTPRNPGTSCRDIKNKASWAADGMYLIDIDGLSVGAPPFQVYCDMTRDGGGWTLMMRTWYQSGLAGNAEGFGSPYEVNMPRDEPYKLPDATIRAIIGSDNHFDLLADQVFHNTQNALGNHEFIVLRNYTGAFTYAGPMAESTTETVLESFRAHDNFLLWRGRLGCGPLAGGAPAGGYGINCDTVLTTSEPVGMPNPAGGAGCVSQFAGSSPNAGSHQLFMGATNTDTYQYICNGAQYTSGNSNVHRWWVR